MAFPAIAALASSRELANVVSHDVALPGGIVAGDVLLLFFVGSTGANFAGTAISGGGWTTVVLDQNTAGAQCHMLIAYRVATGSEGAALVVTTTNAQVSEHAVARITGGHQATPPAVSAKTTGFSGNPNGAALTPAWGAEDTLWFAVGGADGDVNPLVWPAGYTHLQHDGNASPEIGAGLNLAARQRNIATEDPAIIDGDQFQNWMAYTLAVRNGPPPPPPSSGGVVPRHW